MRTMQKHQNKNKKEDYKNNVEANLNNSEMYEKLNNDPTVKTEDVVIKHV